ncbi:MAG: hypothetical protein JWQ23_2882 [Herminiimonas sp.]|nr:hypothetical protein [Herminiimonas sp.]
MSINISPNSRELDLYRSMLAANNLTLAHIARNAPLAETLSCIVNGIEGQYPEILGAILLLAEDGNRLHLGAAPSLHRNYIAEIDELAIDAGAWLHQPVSVTAGHIDPANIESSKFWPGFRDLALRHGLYTCLATPIRSAADSLLGIFIAYSREPDRAGDGHRHAIADVTALASIAIERSIAEVRIENVVASLRESETRMALAIEGSGTGIWDRDVVTGEIHYSKGWKAILGYTESELSNWIGDSYTRLHADDLPFVKEAMQAHFDQKTESYAVEHRIRCKDGSYKWISSRGKVVSRDMDGNPLRMIGTTTDITSMRTLSENLQQSVDLITSLTNEIPGLVYQHRLLPDGAEFFSYVSEGICDIYELTPAQVAEDFSLIHERIHPDDLADYRATLDASAASLTPWHFEYRVILPRQGLRWRRGDARPRRSQDGGTLWHGFITDITERKRVEIELQEFATIDFLTQLPNRRHFMARMREELARLQRAPGMQTAVLMCDLDHFKMVNDRYGHAIGDLVLRHFASILGNELRRNDTGGRVGGEEFAVVLPGAGMAEAAIFAKRVQKQIAETPLVEGDITIAVTVSIGIALMQANDTNVKAALTRSDMALYRAKGSGRNRIEMAPH